MKCFAVNYNTNVEVIVMSLNSQPYAENGVFISNSSLSVGEEVAITYEGLLAKSGADQIFLHIGYGEEWLDKTFIPMERENGVFKGTFKIALPDDLNISFKDSANNWDNNSSMNYSFKITGKTKAAFIMGKLFDTDIISVDSMQAFKGMDIGTDKQDLSKYFIKQYI